MPKPWDETRPVEVNGVKYTLAAVQDSPGGDRRDVFFAVFSHDGEPEKRILSFKVIMPNIDLSAVHDRDQSSEKALQAPLREIGFKHALDHMTGKTTIKEGAEIPVYHDGYSAVLQALRSQD